jgi:hypothetical protein
MTPKSVLPVRGIEVLSDGRFIRPIPAVSTLTSEHAGWDGIALESYYNVPGCDIAEHEHPTHLLNLLVGDPVRAEWTTEGRCRSAINEPGTIYLLPRGTRDKVAWRHQSSRVLLAIDPKFLAQSIEETAHLEDVLLTPHWELKDRHIAALMMALQADLEDGQPKSTVWLSWQAATAVSRMPDEMVSRTPINLTRSAFNPTLNTEAVGRTAMTPASRSNAARPLACRLAARARFHQLLPLRDSQLRRAAQRQFSTL